MGGGFMEDLGPIYLTHMPLTVFSLTRVTGRGDVHRLALEDVLQK
jgi:hypothetical protein